MSPVLGPPAPWAGLPAAERAIDLDDVRACFAQEGSPRVERGDPASFRAAAVLIPVFGEAGEARVVFTRRPDTMPDHQGQVAFPGGKVDPAIDASPRDTALREAAEEIGLASASVEVVAALPAFYTVASNFVIDPFVGIIAGGRPTLAPDPREVEHVFDAAVSELLADGAFRVEHWDVPGRGEVPIQIYDVGGEFIWGATARILTRFLTTVTGSVPA